MSESIPNEPNPGGGGTSGPGAPSRPKPSDDQQWRTRALAAQERVAELQAKLEECQKLLEDARQESQASQRRAQLERALAALGAIDLETAGMLAEQAIAADPALDAEAAARQLRETKPYLFRARAGSRGSAMSGVPGRDETDVQRAALEARSSGDRAALLRYLRMRRSV